MTISRKLNKSVTTTLITLLMLSAFVGLISFANAAVVNSPSTIAFSAKGDTSFAQWSNAQADLGDYSAALGGTSATATDYAQVKVPTNFLFGQPDQDLGSNTVLSFRGYVVEAATDSLFTIRLYMDSNNDGTTDYYFTTPVSPSPASGISQWVVYSGNAWTVVNTTKQGQNFGTEVHGVAVSSPATTYAAWNATAGFAEDKVVGVAVYVSGLDNGLFVDTLMVGATTYNLEPTAMTFFPVLALVQPATASAPPASTVNIMAAAGSFDASEQVVSFFQGVGPSIDSTDSSADGSVLGDFTVPNLAAGTYTITSIGLDSGKSFTGQFTISAPSIDFSKSKASVGSEITVTGTNFRASATGVINITFNGAPWNGALLDTTAAGGFTSGALVVPDLAPGTYTVSATDGLNTATKDFTIPVVAITKVDPSSGPTGSTVVLSGEGFTRNGLVQLFVNGVLFKSLVADAFGALPSPANAIVINGAPGTVTIYALDVTTGISSAEVTFTIKSPTLNAGLRIPSTSTNTAITNGPVGATVWVNGTNFKVGAAINVTLGINGPQICATPLPTAGTTGFNIGKLSTISCIIPDVAPGAYVIAATDGVNTATTSFTVNAPAITLTPAAGPVGTAFTVAGTNFKAGGAVTIDFNGTTALTGTTADENGTISVPQTVPAGYPIGAYIVNATDGVNFAEATFNIGAAVQTLTPDEGPPGTEVTVEGKGFTEDGVVNIYFGETLVSTVNADEDGLIDTVISVPDVAAGEYDVTAYDVATALTTPAVTFTVSEPTLAVNPTESQVGQLIMASGTLYKINSTVEIFFNGELVATVAANGVGTLPANANFTVPSVVPGAYIVNATDGVNFATAQFNVFGTGGIDEVLTIVTEIKATLAEFGTFYNFTNNWFMTIDNKLGNFTGNDTVASLLYHIEADLHAPDNLVFDFGGASVNDMSSIHISNSTNDVYSEDLGFGWLDITDLQYRERASALRKDLKGFVCSTEDAVFQVALPNGEYMVSVVQGDSAWAHDQMTIIANGEQIASVDTPMGEFIQTKFIATVEDGLLQITFGDAGGSDGNWVLNGLVIRQSWAPATA